MNAVTEILRSLKHKEIIVCVGKNLLLGICLILMITVDNLIAERISPNWHPTLGFVFGVSIATFLGCWLVFPLLKKIKTMETTKTKKIAWFSGKMLTILGATLVLLNDSIALIFNVWPLNTFSVFIIIGGCMLCAGLSITVLADEPTKVERVWVFGFIILYTVLFVGVLIKYVFI